MATWQIELAGYIIGSVGAIIASVYWLKYTATKANIEGKNETISTQNGQIEAFKDEIQRVTISEQSYKKQAEALREIAQQTPQIVALTQAITQLAGSIQKQHAENSKDRKQTTEILKKLLKERADDRSQP